MTGALGMIQSCFLFTEPENEEKGRVFVSESLLWLCGWRRGKGLVRLRVEETRGNKISSVVIASLLLGQQQNEYRGLDAS